MNKFLLLFALGAGLSMVIYRVSFGKAGLSLKPRAPPGFTSPEHMTVQWPERDDVVLAGRFEDDGVTPLKLSAYRWPSKPEGKTPRALLFLLHGYGDHSDANAYIAREFAEDGVMTFSLDMVGHGRSGGLPGYMENFTEVVEDCVLFARAEVAKYPGVNDVFVLGESMGGMVSIRMLHEAPDLFDGGILVAPAVKMGEDMYPLLKYIVRFLAAVVPRLVLAADVSDESGLEGMVNNVDIHFHYQQDPLTYRGGMCAGTGVGFLDSFEFIDKNVKSELRQPLLIFQGAKDAVISPAATKEFYEAVPAVDKTFLHFPEEAHSLMRDFNWKMHVETMRKWIKDRLTEHS